MKLFSRRSFLALLAAAVLGGCAANATRDAQPPIIFVHGNGDTAALWYTMAWRFESNGWPRDRLFALDMPYPLARNDDSKPQEGRTSAAESMRQLADEVARVRKLTGADKVVLIGNSRGGNAIRNYIRNGGGAATVSHAILGGTPNHGVWASSDYLPGNEFNGKGPFLTALNAPQGPGGLETTPGVAFMTLRSDGNDKYAQPDGRWVGQPKMQTHVGFDGPELKGAENIVLPGLDHRETSYHRLAFVNMYRFITGQTPGTQRHRGGGGGGARRPHHRLSRRRSDQPAACRRVAGNLRNRAANRGAPRPGGAREDRRRGRPMGPVCREAGRCLRIRDSRRRFRRHAHLPLAVPAFIQPDPSPARPHRRRRQGRGQRGDHDAAARLLRRRARQHEPGRRQPAARPAARRAGRGGMRS